MKLKNITKKDQDNLFKNMDYPMPFQFDSRVATVFDDMVIRSVPFYREVMDLAYWWLNEFAGENSLIYDLGCSTGATIQVLGEKLKTPGHFIGVDNSLPMIEKATKKNQPNPSHHRFEFHQGDIRSFPLKKCCFVILNYTLQFLPIKDRSDLIKKIYESLDNSGILFISEKIRFEQSRFQEVSQNLYMNFKMKNGYTKTEVERKKEALENVLIPLTEKEQIDLFRSAGFKKIETIFKWNNFATFIAQK